ncbi:protein lin-37 homolog isoform X2 [Clavelina lepadiformis]|uniref:Protein lin-37 homolog n=1 Tax=Clavelina lepadiformis TaxID=159417 RepID=A0ABP0GCS0_CLALP
MSECLSEQELDAHDARADFENLLQGIIAKANAGESLGAQNSGNEEEKDYEDSQKGLSTPSKMTRKRRRKDDQKDDKLKSNSFIMKLFDRSVDLAAFNDNTSLYPVCRAWMENDPSGKNKTKQMNGRGEHKHPDDEASEDEETVGSITEISPPKIPWSNMDENGQYTSPRVPDLLPQPKDKLEMYLKNQTVTPQAETLLVNHLRHWKKVRETWIEKSRENESRYRDSMDTLKEIFQRNVYNNSAT